MRGASSLEPLSTEITPKANGARSISVQFQTGRGCDSGVLKERVPIPPCEKSLLHGQVPKKVFVQLDVTEAAGYPLVRFIMRCKNILPGTTALHANCKVLISDCNFTSRMERHLAKEFSKSWAHRSLSSGSLASIRVESSSIPMNSST